MKIISVVGARPNFMKVAPFIHAISKHNKTNGNKVDHLLVHTGQHYDDRMSKAFFEALNIPAADINLGIGSGSHAEQVGNTMIELEKVFLREKPDWIFIYGDVNATLASSVTAKKLHINVCHVEAGLRSGDLKMPEEINRLVTDRLSDLLLTPDTMSSENLRKEGVEDSKIVFTGNIMIDTLEANREKAEKLDVIEIIKKNLIYKRDIKFNPKKEFGVMTMHRPSNVDNKEVLTALVELLCNEIVEKLPLLWTVHPRTEKQLKSFNLWERIENHPDIHLLHPLGYHDMLKLNMEARIMLTDSGGLQEECTVLGTPCLTMRWNTERPITLRDHGGASVLVGNDIERIKKAFYETLSQDRLPQRPELWDGKTAERCLETVLNFK